MCRGRDSRHVHAVYLEQTRQYLRDRGIKPYAPGEEDWQAA